MVSRLSSAAVSARPDLADWRVIRRRLDATFRAGSFDEASTFVATVARAAEQADHHPDVDLRYPGIVHVTLTTHAVDGLTKHDLDLAVTISALAAHAGLTSEATTAMAVEVAIDALDIPAVLPFWRALLGYRDETPSPRDDPVDAIVDPLRIGPSVWFQQMDAPRPQRNRVHVDVIVPHDVADERIAAAIAAGGRLVSAAEAPAFWVLADPEGNEACVCTWQVPD